MVDTSVGSPSRSAFIPDQDSVKREKMNGTRVLRNVPPPLSPMDLAAQLCISESPPLRRWLGVTSPRMAPRSFNHLLSPPSSPDSPLSRSPIFRRKKRVMFADARGLPLATVRYFSEDEEEEEEEQAPRSPAPAETPPGVAWLPGPGAANQAGERAPELRPPSRGWRHLRLRLGFPPPAADLAAFRARLQEELVLLESCRVSGESLSGTVRARNLGSDKAAHVRVTFDSWRSHRDVPCVHQPPTPSSAPGTADTDLFAFDIPLPEKLDPRERLEFCVAFRHGKGAVLWDKNKGKNYRVLVGSDSDTPAASLLASHRSSLTLPSRRRGMWDTLQRGGGPRPVHATGSLMFRNSRLVGGECRSPTPPGSPVGDRF
ncbi:protein phosphatase 1 regulatory subunit 3C-B-like isoform X2 [Anguilla anguilla]|uniref:protein phosphatase 1 regulatory subunit 3C-B-like isoform X2 n=1 Tax=Anguilla anguilla TaxID=7936 RepID=UPI0015AC3042|nr:protein phosphatase 1 regulatory subunit 3C-B-like isoform X2 [Anguilla anguilla]